MISKRVKIIKGVSDINSIYKQSSVYNDNGNPIVDLSKYSEHPEKLFDMLYKKYPILGLHESTATIFDEAYMDRVYEQSGFQNKNFFVKTLKYYKKKYNNVYVYNRLRDVFLLN